MDAIREQLYTPVVGDILDELGYRRQFLPPEIRGIRETSRVVGRAMPVLVADVVGPQRVPFGRLTEALDQLEPGEVYIAQNATVPCSAWGEILTATARQRGAVGAVVDGYHRDTPRVLEQDFPVFSRGGYAQDAAVRASVLDYRCRIRIGDVEIEPGDLIFGDLDGVIVIPAAVEDEVIERALAKASTENTVRQAIEAGMSSTEALRTYGVL
ncbi:RraA family protein [Homoserinibacter sp. YIM 151385]|uniref:RraA family protein n=1 Tax=Homoserinibacter sp. YIM 151385 TaxID=2985506 RepID=UPI0022F0B44D|nr:RraA family protein [Homoserinibacter sp. YIM 151385]WBU37518.1 RraA family protein [Homoserinibacter sp. YIM 151385]